MSCTNVFNIMDALNKDPHLELYMRRHISTSLTYYEFHANLYERRSDGEKGHPIVSGKSKESLNDAIRVMSKALVDKLSNDANDLSKKAEVLRNAMRLED